MSGGFELAYPLGGDSGYIEVYRDSILGLLPPGSAFSRDESSNVHDLAERMACEFARVRDRADDLRNDFVPSRTIELLDEWERALGLPTACFSPANDDERRAAIIGRLTDSLGHSLDDYRAMATALGYDGASVSATIYPPFTCESPCTDGLYGDDWANVVTWTIPTGPTDALVECVFESKRRSHSTFGYVFA